MTPEQAEALQTYVDAIAQILYNDSDSENLTTLESIETTVRAKVQEHVSPRIGAFLSERLQAQAQDESDI